jgi:phage/plasmid-associated DNA primase
VQLLSGGDGIPAKPLYRDPLTIQPRHLCILTTSHMPELNEVVTAMVERFQVVPFPVTFVDLAEGEAPTAVRRQRDNSLKQRFLADQQGLLRWLVAGAVAWYATRDLKRNAPEKVKEFGRRYFQQQDKIASFIQERCVVSACASPSSIDLRGEMPWRAMHAGMPLYLVISKPHTWMDSVMIQ